VAGPRVLEHMVDTVLCLEGSDQSDHRVLRATKNRFGSTSEIGILSMAPSGLQDVSNPSELFLSSNLMRQGQDGSTVVVILEGTRPILVEVQALVGSFIPPSIKSGARRTVEGYSIQRLLLICAVIEKSLKITLYNRDIYVNIVGGLRISEPAADLSVAVALVSSYLSLSIKKNIAFIGEIGLGGELRNCRNIDSRIQEAKNMGFDEVIIPRKKTQPWSNNNKKSIASQEMYGNISSAPNEGVKGDTVSSKKVKSIECGSLREALNAAFDVSSIDELIASIKSKRKTKVDRSVVNDDDIESNEYSD